MDTTTTTEFVVVTGCTQGLGYHAVVELARTLPPGVQVVMACRDVAAARAAAARVGSDRLVVLDAPLDLSDLDSVRAYAAALRAHLAAAGAPHGVTRLVNNAGIGGNAAYRKNTRGHELIFATNHLGHFLLTLLVLPLSKAAEADGRLRVVNVSSEVHDPENGAPLPDPSQHWPATPEDYDRSLAAGEPLEGDTPRDAGGRRYTRSKLCNVLFTNELARRLSGAVTHGSDPAVAAALAALPEARSCTLPGAGVAEVLAFNPGLMLDTGFVTGFAGGVAGFIARVLTPLLRILPIGRFIRSGPSSGIALAHVTTASDLPVTTAAYYDGPALKLSSAFSRSHEGATVAQQEVWTHSLRWAEVTPEERAAAGFAP